MNRNKTVGSEEQPFISHLVELRDRLLRVILAVAVIFLGLAMYANQIYSYLAGPLLKHLPEHSTMIAIDVASPFLTPFKLALVLAIFLSVPVILYQFWAFVAPGLYKHEQRLILPLLIASTLLFYLGVAFAYYLVFPLVFGFLNAPYLANGRYREAKNYIRMSARGRIKNNRLERRQHEFKSTW